MRPDRAAPRSKGESGFILIVVLWVLGALAALAGTYLVYVDNVAMATHLDDDRLRINNAISTGSELTAYKLLASPDDGRPPKGAFTVRLARSTVSVTFVSEGARIDLNAAPKGMLAGLFTAVGLSSSNAATFADRIVAWRTRAGGAGKNPAGQSPGQDTSAPNDSSPGAGQNNAGQNNAGQGDAGQNDPQANAGPTDAEQNNEIEDYRKAGYAYAPRQAPFQNVLELPLVLGIPPYVIERVLPLVTVFNGGAQIDVRVAPAEVLAALPNATPEEVQKVLAQRAQDPTDGDSLLQILGSARASATVKTSPAARVRMQIRLDDGRVAQAEVVIIVSKGGGEPYRVLSWRDDSDGPI